MEPVLNKNPEVPETLELHSADFTDVMDQNHGASVSSPSIDSGTESKHKITEEEVRNILEVIAATGKFWHDWDKLKSMLSFYLSQILSEYPEAKMTSEQQISLLGETYVELVKRLDDALHSFIEGPPFTLQRLSEILLAARSIYSNLSKLALALEKNLLVTSTLTISADPYPSHLIKTVNEPEKEDEPPQGPQLQSNSEQNGAEPMAVDKDEMVTSDIRPHVENDMGNEMMLDMSAFEELVVRPEDPVPKVIDEP